jgi:hypothetical protein
MVQYTIAEIINIKNEGFDYQLSGDVIAILRELHRNFKPNVEVIKKINFKKSKLVFNKPTTILKEDAKVNSLTAIKLLLNKVSPKNYLDCIDKLCAMIEPIQDETELSQIAELVFEIASTNRFYTNIYADIYSHLIITIQIKEPSSSSSAITSSENVFYRHYKTVYGTFLGMFENMVYFDPNTDYDQFCAMNTMNEKRNIYCRAKPCK